MSSSNRNPGILLESGTNEVEIIEFYVRGQSFGVNVAKVKQIIPLDHTALSAMPQTASAFRGVYLHRDTTIPMIDLGDALRLEPLPDGALSPLLLICNFNMRTMAFAIDGVNRIHRLSWSKFTPLNTFLATSCDSIIGSVNIDHREILIVDLEQIVSEYDPRVKAMYAGDDDSVDSGTSIYEQRIIMAEDSSLIRAVLEKGMRKAGFTNVSIYPNGQEALDAVTAIAKEASRRGVPLRGRLDAVVTDIEMPLMDGLTLCRKIKEELHIDVLVMIYSSLINSQMALKCEKVGADAYFSKPNIAALVNSVKEHLAVLGS